MKTILKNLKHSVRSILSTRIIFDREPRNGNFHTGEVSYPVHLNKEEVARKYILGSGQKKRNFLDVGARDGLLTYLLGISENLKYDENLYKKNKEEFDTLYRYYGMDIAPSQEANILVGDICNVDYLAQHSDFNEKFSIIYSNNVFEHLRQPWHAAKNLLQLTTAEGIIITIVPFSQRYHESPGDYFRYTHKGIEALFQDAAAELNAKVEILESGYDILGRRNNWQGSGAANDLVPVDHFGAWRETWYTVVVVRKVRSSWL